MSHRLRGRARRIGRVIPALAAGLLVQTPAVSAVAEPRAGGAAPPSLLLEWSGPGPELDCLGEDGLKRAVNDYLGRDAFEAPFAFTLHVDVERLPDRHFRAVLEVDDASGRALGTREITSSTELCSSLDDHLVLAVALLADNGPEQDEAPPPPPPRVREPETVEPDEDVEQEATPVAPVARRPWSWLAAEAALSVESGVLPAVRPGVAVGLRLEPLSWLAVRAGGVAFLPASTELGGASVGFWLTAGRLELCAGDWSVTAFQVAFCGGALYAALGATPRGVSGGHARTSGQLAGSVGFYGALPLRGRWSFIANLTALFPDRPERFLVEVNSAPRLLFQMSKPALLASFGGALTF
ncbi:MAG TPA: hypothetical protein VMI54_04470 [Polyangiaceae bacterium]|nr:hypothetical protein [Polyangiaceae bacterium]